MREYVDRIAEAVGLEPIWRDEGLLVEFGYRRGHIRTYLQMNLVDTWDDAPVVDLTQGCQELQRARESRMQLRWVHSINSGFNVRSRSWGPMGLLLAEETLGYVIGRINGLKEYMYTPAVDSNDYNFLLDILKDCTDRESFLARVQEVIRNIYAPGKRASQEGQGPIYPQPRFHAWVFALRVADIGKSFGEEKRVEYLFDMAAKADAAARILC